MVCHFAIVERALDVVELDRLKNKTVDEKVKNLVENRIKLFVAYFSCPRDRGGYHHGRDR